MYIYPTIAPAALMKSETILDSKELAVHLTLVDKWNAHSYPA